MNKIYKIAIFASSLLVVFALANFVLAETGYFMEKGKDFYIFDNLYINGYLTVGNDNLGKEANFGDVLVGKEFYMDDNQSLVFCQDERQAGSNLPLNRDCSNKIMIWSSDANEGLRAINPLFTRIKTDKIEVSGQITLKYVGSGTTTPWVLASGGTRVIGGCFSNGGSCSDGYLTTERIYLKNLRYLSATGGGFIKVSGTTIKLGAVDLGKLEHFRRHAIFWVGGYAGTSLLCTQGKTSFKADQFVDINTDKTGSDPARPDKTITSAFGGVDEQSLCGWINPLF